MTKKIDLSKDVLWTYYWWGFDGWSSSSRQAERLVNYRMDNDKRIIGLDVESWNIKRTTMCESKYGTYSSTNLCIKVVVEGIQKHFLLDI